MKTYQSTIVFPISTFVDFHKCYSSVWYTVLGAKYLLGPAFTAMYPRSTCIIFCQPMVIFYALASSALPLNCIRKPWIQLLENALPKCCLKKVLYVVVLPRSSYSKVVRPRRTYIYSITHLDQALNCTWKTLILISFYWLCVIIVTFSSGLIDTKALYFFLFISSSAGTQVSYMFDIIVCYIV